MRKVMSLLALSILSLILSLSGVRAEAGTVDVVKLSTIPVVMVWEGDLPPLVPVLNASPPSEPDVLPVLLSGVLEPVGPMAALVPLETQSKCFHVATNSPYAISAEVDSSQNDDYGELDFRIVHIGRNAQVEQGTEGSGRPWFLSELSRASIVYRSRIKTAKSSGSVSSQAVTFCGEWTSRTSATIEFTVFIP